MSIPLSEQIDACDPRIAKFHTEWARNRAIIEGERAVKSKEMSETFLYRSQKLKDHEYNGLKTRTKFVPGASRAHEGLMGLIFRKEGTTLAPDNVLPILETITSDGYTIDDLAEDVVSEFLITNFVGLLTDHAPAPAGISRAKAIELGHAPEIALYKAESILGIETAKIAGRLRVRRVRLLEGDDKDQVRELRIDDGIYTVNIWNKPKDRSEWTISETIVPLIAGKPIDQIPFTLVTTNKKFLPAKARMNDVVDLNVQHYIASANLANVSYMVGNPTPFVFGPKVGELSLQLGVFMNVECDDGSMVQTGMLVAPDGAIEHLRRTVSDISDDMAKVSSRILAAEKAGVESADTQVVRSVVENAANASTARLCSRWINDALKWVSYWLGLDENAITYELNTDYAIGKLDPQAVEGNVNLWKEGVISKDTLIDILLSGEILPENFDRELDAQKISEEVALRPAIDV